MSDIKLKELFAIENMELRRKEESYKLTVEGIPACSEGCPAGVNVKSYLNLVADKRYEEALRVILEKNPFPGICGRVCTSPCELNCENQDAPVAIKLIKRFAADYEMSRRLLGGKPEPVKYEEKVAVVGAGPAGLTAARDLCKLGYAVTVFDDCSKPGGLMHSGIPRFRLPGPILDFEIEYIKQTGVKIVTGLCVSRASDITGEGYSALVLAAGAKKDMALDIPGKDAGGVVGCLAFLLRVSNGDESPIHGTAVVIGGGNAAMDAARTARRLGANVIIAYRRTEAEMPANSEEVQAAKDEGIELQTLKIPKEILAGEDGKVKGMTFQNAKLGEPDDSGRRRPVAIPDSEFALDADWVIPAIGQVPDAANFSDKFSITKWGTIEVDDNNVTGDETVFAAGDVVLGPSSIVEAIGSGHAAAAGVHRKLNPKDAFVEDGESGLMLAAKSMDATKTDTSGKRREMKLHPDCVDIGDVCNDFREVELCSSEPDTLTEARRCNKCGSCHECYVCLSTCENHQLLAQADGVSFLMKSESELSKSVMDENNDWDIVTPDGQKKPVTLSHILPEIDESKCISCGLCEEACSYNAIQVRLKRNGEGCACVDVDVCRSCGACVAACPTGAMSQGGLSPEVLREKLGTLGCANDNQILTISCHWNDASSEFSNDFLELMCTRMAGPDIIADAFSRGFKGVNIMACPDKKGCHYLPARRPTSEFVGDLSSFMELSGHGLGRVAYGKASLVEREAKEKAFETLQSMALPRCANSAQTPLSRLLYLSPVRRDMEMSCMEHVLVLDAAFKVFNLDCLDELTSSTFKITGCQDPEAADGRSLFDLARKLLDEKGLEPTGKMDAKIAYLDNDPHKDFIEALISKLPGVSGIVLNDTGLAGFWPDMDRAARDSGIDFLRKVEEKGADVFVTGSLEILAMLRTLTREGAWQVSQISVTDPLTLLLASFKCEGGV